ncbi:MAG: ABC transporter permease [Myxococcales bacterium]|nr:ABC transporter permease [Myxococcales bacterium]
MTGFLASLVTLGFVAQVIRISIPYVLAALGGTVTERSGVIDLALEAKLLMGAFAAAVVTYETGSLAVGVVAAAGAGAGVAAIQALWSVRLGAEQVVTGIALNLGAFGFTRYFLGVRYGQGTNSPKIDGLGTTVLTNPLTWIAGTLVAVTVVGLWHARLGLRIRAVGEHPEATAAAGVSVARVRWTAVVLGGALAGLGGAQLSLPVDGFVAEASGGRGYVALVAVIMSGWRPGRAALLCVAFGAADAAQFRMQSRGLGLPPELVKLMPYALALALLAAWPRRTPPPRALGQPW